MTFDQLLESKNNLVEQVDVLRSEMAEKGKEFFLAHFAPLFDAHPEVKFFRWTQYTPYFNDGDECVFSSNHEWGECFTGNEDEEVEEGESQLEYEHPSHEAFQKHFPALNDDDMKAIFGDHKEIRLYRDHVDVEDYDHE